VIGLYYYGEATMKQIGAEIGVNESRVSQLHARAVQRLRKALGAECPAQDAISPAVLSFQHTMRRLRMAKADMPQQPGVVLQYRTPQAEAKPAARRRTVMPGRAAVAAAR
jgi:RNA polymerase sigma factor for flagellar operon FliA